MLLKIGRSLIVFILLLFWFLLLWLMLLLLPLYFPSEWPYSFPQFFIGWGVWGVWGVRKYISFIALYFRLLILYIEYSGFLRISPIYLVLLPKELAYGLKRNTP